MDGVTLLLLINVQAILRENLYNEKCKLRCKLAIGTCRCPLNNEVIRLASELYTVRLRK